METTLGAPDRAATTYGVKLEVFEGPLDLLLYLIRKEELDIYDIPVARITTQYLSFLDQIHQLNLEQAGEFILMAATLMRIKSQMLLPRDEASDDDEALDPRDELVRRLLEYQQFKEVADWLGDQGRQQRDVMARRAGPGEIPDSEKGLKPVSLFDLLKAYQYALDHAPKTAIHRIVRENVSVEECLERVLELLERRARLRFWDLVEGRSRTNLVATFIALLELLKSQRIRVQQAEPFADIWIESRTPDEGSPVAAEQTPPETGPDAAPQERPSGE